MWGIKLRKHRLQLKFSAHEIADELNVSQGTYHNWKTDKTTLPAKYLPKLAEIFKTDVTELMPENTVVKIMNNQEQKSHAIVGFEVTLDARELYKDLLSSKDEIITMLKAENSHLKARNEELEGEAITREDLQKPVQ